MQGPAIFTVLSYGFGIVGILGTAFAFLRYSGYQATVNLQNDNIKALKDQNLLLKEELDEVKRSHESAGLAIADLQRQLKDFREVPLQQLSQSMTKMADTQERILEIIGKMPTFDNGLVVKTKDGQTATVKVE